MKRWILVLTLIWAMTNVWADDVSQKQAQTKAQQFLSKKNLVSKTLQPVETRRLLARGKSVKQQDCFYVFNVGQNEGYVIVSADDRAEDILGYSLTGSLDVDNLPPNMVSWLQGYVDEITYLREHNIQPTATRAVKKARTPVSPLIKTHWGQGYPYNMGYPEFQGQTCITGCVATAVAQVLYYYRHPDVTTEIPGYKTPTHGIQMPTLSPTTFDWDNMALSYSGNTTDAQKQAVSHLMIYCSTAVRANLDPEGTGASSYNELLALRNYFGFQRAKEKSKEYFTLREWEDMVCEELAGQHPLLYCGFTSDPTGSGHAFILDGYDGEKYHFNWGWYGTADGYFALSSLQPSSTDFSWGQAAIFGLSTDNQGPEVYDEDVRMTTDVFYPYNNQGYSRITSTDGVGHYNVKFGAKITSYLKGEYDMDVNYAIYKDGELIEYLYPFEVERPKFGLHWNVTERYFFPSDYEVMLTLPFADNDGNGNITHSKSFRTPGTYYIIPVSRMHGDLEWKVNHNSDKKFLKAVIDANDVLTLYKGDPTEFPIGQVTPPASEVTEEQLAELEKTYETLKKDVEAKQAELASAAKVKSDVDQGRETLSDLDNQLGDLTQLLNSRSDVLTFQQIQEYKDQIKLLTAEIEEKDGVLRTTSWALEDWSSDEVEQQLTQLTKDINYQLAIIPSIKKKADLEASQTKAESLRKQVDECDVSQLTQQVAEAGKALDGLKELQKKVKDLINAVNEAIGEGTEVVIPEITADDKTREYGEENPVFTYTASAEFNGEPELTTTATVTSPVGDYDITVERGTIEGEFTAVKGTLTITEAPLTIGCGNYTIMQGEALPTFKATYTGFKNDETEDVLITKPTLWTTATSESEPGEYDIDVYGAEAKNYDISYEKGTLTITPDTGIDDLSVDGKPADIYDLSGRKVTQTITSLKLLKKGVYIIKGRKVVK